MRIKQCSKCWKDKEASEFFKSGGNKIRGDCKECSKRDTSLWRKKNREHYNQYMGDWRTKNPDKIRAIDMKRKYGLSIEEYGKILKNQNGVCKICDRGPVGKRPLAIDHCHSTGKIRGLLCYRCNRAIVILDDKNHLEKALKYLQV